MAAHLYKSSSGKYFHAGEIVLVVVGLPGRGKTFLSNRLNRYLKWIGINSGVFSVGDYRRKIIGNNLTPTFFGYENSQPSKLRMEIADMAMVDMLSFLEKGGQVGIYDYSSVVQSERKAIWDRLVEKGIKVCFIEVICDLPEIIEKNIKEVTCPSPEYEGWDPDDIVKDFIKKIEIHENHYETLNNPEFSYIKLINAGSKYIIHKWEGFLQSKILFFLLNVRHMTPQKIYFCATGHTRKDIDFKDESGLTEEGISLAKKLYDFFYEGNKGKKLSPNLKVWVSPRKYSYETARYFDPSIVETCSVLTEKNAGLTWGMTVDQIKEKYPGEYELHLKNKYMHRYPRAESYHDLAKRLEQIIAQMENGRHDTLIIAHPTVIRCLYGYYFGIPGEEIPRIQIPRNMLMEIEPNPFGCNERHHILQTMSFTDISQE